MGKFEWLNSNSREYLKRGYLQKGVKAEDRIRQIAQIAQERLNKEGFADKFYEYMSKGWYSLSSPVWANYGLNRGMPVSCFGSLVEDSVASMLDLGTEIGIMSKMGGGTSLYMNNIRRRGAPISTGGEADGPVHYALHYDTIIDIFKQSTTRRGSCAIYLDIEHDDIDEWLNIRKENHPIQNLQTGICVGDNWMKEMIDGDSKKRKIWAKVIQTRSETGFPYIFFKDTVNRLAPEVYKDKGKIIKASNLCSEICLSSSEDESFVCVLGSMNLLYYDEWKDTDAVETYIYFLDTVVTEFLEKSKDDYYLRRAYKFAKEQRALGLGVLGWHSYLQSKMIPFEGLKSHLLNIEIFKNIQNKAELATKKLALEYGEPELMKGTGRRNATVMAIAPTKSSSFILGEVSMSIEPIKSNYFIKDLAKSKTIYKNPFLEKLLIQKNKDFKYVWKSIMDNNGSVQHLDFLTEDEKNVFKTFIEISPAEIIQQASSRQRFIDQSQSLNLAIHPSISAKDINKLLISAWDSGVKTLYYQYSESAVMSFARDINNCTSCEG